MKNFPRPTVEFLSAHWQKDPWIWGLQTCFCFLALNKSLPISGCVSISLTDIPIIRSLLADTADPECLCNFEWQNRFSQDRQVASLRHLDILHRMPWFRLKCRAPSKNPQTWRLFPPFSTGSADFPAVLNYWFGFYTLRNPSHSIYGEK